MRLQHFIRVDSGKENLNEKETDNKVYATSTNMVKGIKYKP